MIFGEDCNHGEQFAGPNDEERGQASVPIRASSPRSSSSVSFALCHAEAHPLDDDVAPCRSMDFRQSQHVRTVEASVISA